MGEPVALVVNAGVGHALRTLYKLHPATYRRVFVNQQPLDIRCDDCCSVAVQLVAHVISPDHIPAVCARLMRIG